MTTRFVPERLDAIKHARSLPLHYLLLAAWVLSMVLLPIAIWILGDEIIRWSVLLSTLLQFAAVMALLVRSWGWRRSISVFAAVAGVSWLAEAIGTATGFPFGDYDYTELLQPQIAHVPVVIPLAWMMLLPSSWAIAGTLTARRGLLFIVVSAAAMTAWDLFLDPQMVAWGFWVWRDGGAYFGIPLLNYAGWLLTAGVITALVRPRDLPVFPLLLIYGVTLFLQSVGQFVFWSMPGPALFGTAGMGGMLLLAWWASQAQTGVIMTILWTVVAYFSGALPLSFWVGRYVLGEDIREYGDGNPGTMNVFRAGGRFWGVVALVLDFMKGVIPVWIAHFYLDMTGLALVLIGIAPIAGHAFSPFLGFRGGKAIMTTFGVWCGLTIWEGPMMFGVLLFFWYAFVVVDGFAVLLALASLLAYFLLTRSFDSVLVGVWAGNTVIVAYKHRMDFKHKLELRDWFRNMSLPWHS